jgi:uncharacterized protein YaiL (DUF2058 family)
MLDLKAKLLAAGVVTADQVKKVEDDEAQKKQRAREARERREQQQHTRTAPREQKHVDDEDEKRARREHEWSEAQRWRQRLDALRAAGKSEQYEAVRGWVMKDRLDNRQISEAAVRFHFVKDDGAVAHLTVEPDVQQRLVDGSAAVVLFMGYNGLEHAVVPKDVADDVRVVKPEWLRHLVGVTDAAAATVSDDVATTLPSTPAEPMP